MSRALLLLVLAVATASANTVYELPKAKATLELPDGWQKIEAPALVAAYKHPGGAVLAVTRADASNGDAYSKDKATRTAYTDAIERGIAASIPGYKRVSKTVSEVNSVPALDVEATRDTGATVIVRVLLFRTYALALAIEVPAKGDIAVARVIATKLLPPKAS